MTTTANKFTSAGGAAYMSDRMDWETPTDLFSRLDEEFHFTLDAASSETNHKCRKYYTLEDSAFDHEWTGETVFCNPPHTVERSPTGYANAAWKPAARTPPSSCSYRHAPIQDGSMTTSSTARKSVSSKAASVSKRTEFPAGRHHSRA